MDETDLDGFLLEPIFAPTDLEDFAHWVVPGAAPPRPAAGGALDRHPPRAADRRRPAPRRPLRRRAHPLNRRFRQPPSVPAARPAP